jgi:hypothetical protein
MRPLRTVGLIVQEFKGIGVSSMLQQSAGRTTPMDAGKLIS